MIPSHHIIIIQLSICYKQIKQSIKAIHKKQHNIFVIVNRISISQFLFEFFFEFLFMIPSFILSYFISFIQSFFVLISIQTKLNHKYTKALLLTIHIFFLNSFYDQHIILHLVMINQSY